MKKYFLLMTAVLAAAMSFGAQPKRELRSIWLTTYQYIDWPSAKSVGNPDACKADLVAYLDKHANRNFNGVCLHVRCWADAVYNSSYEPFSEFVSGERGLDPGWDPLAFAVEECHKRGLECYAWINPFRFNRYGNPRETPSDRYVLSQPGWIIDNGTVTEHKEYQVFNPALPEVRRYLLDIMREIYTKYRIDGMLFDDYFYPNGIPANSTAQDYVHFKEQNPTLEGTSTQIGDWRRNNINTFMVELYNMIQADRPDMRFGLSPAGVAKKGCSAIDGLEPVPFGSDWQYDDIYSDPVAWLADGSIDFISPQIYWFSRPGNASYTTAAPYDGLCRWWSETAHFFGRHFYSSMAPYRMIDSKGNPVYNNEAHWSDLSNQIDLNRQFNMDNAPGAIMYSAKYMDGPVCSGWGEYLQDKSFRTKCLVPVVDWKNSERPSKPSGLVLENGKTLRWNTLSTPPGVYDPIVRYTVYAIPAYLKATDAMNPDGDGLDVNYLEQIVYGSEYTLPTGKREGYWYAVCTYDGYGFESEPATVNEDAPPVSVARDETVYPTVGDIKIENLWFRSVTEPFDNIEFAENGKNNRGMVIAGNRVLVSGRHNTSEGPAYLTAFDLTHGYRLGEINITGIDPDENYPCNDIFRDNTGNIYLSNISTNIASTASPLVIYRFDPETDTAVKWVTLTCPSLTRSRVDHCAVEVLTDGTFHVYAAVSSGKKIIRWTVTALGDVSDTVVKDVDAFVPSGSRNFGTAPRIATLGNGRLLIDGAATAVTEYDFNTDKASVVSSPAGDAAPAGTESNGMTRFGNPVYHIAYAAADHNSATGYKFNITGGATQTFADQKMLWQIPAVNIGSTSSTTMSTPLDAVTTGSADQWTTHLAIYAPGNGVAVYKITKGDAGADDITDDKLTCTVVGGRAYFTAPVDASVYDTAGRLIHRLGSTTSISLPETPGIYILRYGSDTRRIAVR